MGTFPFGPIALQSEYWDEPYPNGGAERGARVELRRVENGELGDPIWRADLFGISGGAPGNHDRAHYHTRFVGWDTGKRRWDEGLRADPVGWVMERLADLPRVLAESEAEAVIPDIDLDQVRNTLPRIRTVIEADMQEPPFHEPRVETIQPTGPLTPLFFLTHAEAAITMLPELAPALGPDRPLYGLGVGTWAEHVPRLNSVEELAREGIRLVRSIRPDGPVVLAGHSFGGLVAFEAARLMWKEGSGPQLLILIDAVPVGALPARTRARMAWRWLRPRILRFVPRPARNLFRSIRDRAAGRPSTLRPNPSIFVGESETPRSQRPRNWRGFPRKGVLRDLTLTYRPKPYEGNVVIYRTERSLDHYRDPTLGWGRHVHGRLELENLPGTHGGAVRPPTIYPLAENLAVRLGRIGSS